MNRMTDRCKNITLLQTSFASGKDQSKKIAFTLGLESIVKEPSRAMACVRLYLDLDWDH